MGILFGRNNNNPMQYVKGGKVFNTIKGVSTAGLLITIAMFVFASFGFIFSFNAPFIGIAGTLLIISFCALQSLYWVRLIERKEFKKTSWVFIGVIAFTCLLWIICLWSIIALYYSAIKGGDIEGQTFATINFIKVVIIISIQFFVSSFVGQGVTKLKKTMIPFQIIAYISYLFVDFIITFILACITISPNGIGIKQICIDLITNKYVIMFLVLTLIYVGVCAGILNIVSKRIVLQEMQKEQVEEAVEKQGIALKTKEEEPDAKLEKLKEMLDKNLITQEEYDAKRKDILDKM